jgi:hypothetical protein
MQFTLSGNTISVSTSHQENAHFPMEVTPDGIVTPVSRLQLLNAWSPMDVTPVSMTTAVICILAVYLNESALIDVSLVYTLLSFLAVVVMCHVVTLHHKGRLLFLSRKDDGKEEEAKEECQ